MATHLSSPRENSSIWPGAGPVHLQLMSYLEALPRVNDYVLGAFPRKSGGAGSQYFGELPDTLEIVAKGGDLVNFNCFRNSFIMRCDVARIPRHATRGMVSQIEDETIDLYSRI